MAYLPPNEVIDAITDFAFSAWQHSSETEPLHGRKYIAIYSGGDRTNLLELHECIDCISVGNVSLVIIADMKRHTIDTFNIMWNSDDEIKGTRVALEYLKTWWEDEDQ